MTKKSKNRIEKDNAKVEAPVATAEVDDENNIIWGFKDAKTLKSLIEIRITGEILIRDKVVVIDKDISDSLYTHYQKIRARSIAQQKYNNELRQIEGLPPMPIS